MWEEIGDRTELQHIDPHSVGHNRVSFLFFWAAQPGAWRPSLSGSWFSLPHLISNSSDPQLINWGPEWSLCWVLAFSTASFSNWSGLQTDWISSSLRYIIVQRPPSSCGRHNFALIQPVHGQGNNILIDRMYLLFTQVHFLFWQPSRIVGQYATPVCGHVI